MKSIVRYLKGRREIWYFYNTRKIISKYNLINNKVIRYALKMVGCFIWYVFHPQFFFKNGVFFHYIEIPLTTNCSLNCKNCSNLMPYYDKQPFEDVDTIISDLQKLLDSVDRIVVFGVLGGEPFLYPDLAKVIKFLVDSKKITKITIKTNGTIFPPIIIEELKNEKVTVEISDYGKYSSKIESWKQCLDVHVKILDANEYWRDFGDLKKRERSFGELETQFANCNTGCYSFFKGKIFRCPRHGHGIDLGIIESVESEYVDIRNNNREQIRKKLSELKQLSCLSACDYCDKGTDSFVKIRAAIQTEKKLLP